MGANNGGSNADAGDLLLQCMPPPQEHLESGRLKLVFWDSTPFVALPLTRSDGKFIVTEVLHTHLAMDFICLNHVYLATWPRAYILALADTDELLYTPKPTTVVKLMQECDDSLRDGTAPEGGWLPLGVLAPPRTLVWCLEGCNSTAAAERIAAGLHPRELEAWLDTSPIEQGENKRVLVALSGKVSSKCWRWGLLLGWLRCLWSGLTGSLLNLLCDSPREGAAL